MRWLIISLIRVCTVDIAQRRFSQSFSSNFKNILLIGQYALILHVWIKAQIIKRTVELANSVDPGQMAHYEPPPLDLQCLPSGL